jgi:tetratricopeptide (TPR) repeat protein
MKAEIEKLFHELADQPSEARPRYLDEHFVDGETRHEVEALLAFDSGASSSLRRDVSIAASLALPLFEATGWRCGPYRLLELAGRGGMGAVYLAERADGEVSQRVAVKLLPVGAGEFQRERLLHERQILASLSHPNIARLLDAGHLGNGQPYLSMEYVDGKPIDVFAAGLSVRQKIALFLKVCAAISYLHRNLVVHRDLKPSNILVTAEGEPKLLDFGIAKILDLATDSTTTSMRVLTPDFASPEQVTGGRVSTATDIYSLGALLYLLLTGKGPHEFEDHSPEAVAQAITAGEVTPPSKRTAELKGDPEAILLKALRKDPQERYPSVSALADDLCRFLGHKPISARPDALAYRAGKFVRRNRTAIALAALTLIVTIAGVTGTLIQSRTAGRQCDFAFHQLARAERISSINEFLITEAAPSGKPITMNEVLERAAHIIERENYSNNPVNHVELLISIGAHYFDLEENERALRVLLEAYQLSRGMREPAARARASCQLAPVLDRAGQHARAESLIEEGIRELPSEPEFALDRVFCLLRGSQLALGGGSAQQAAARARSAERVLMESPFQSDSLKLAVLLDLASAYTFAGQSREAVAEFEKASAQMSKLGYDETRTAVKMFSNWAFALHLADRTYEAEKVLRRAIDLSHSTHADEAVTPALLNQNGTILLVLGRLEESAGYVERAYAKAKEVGDQVVLEQSLLNRARIYRNQRDFTRASAMLMEVEPLLRRDLPSGHYAFGKVANERALLAQAQGDLSTALRLNGEAIAITEAAIKAGGQGWLGGLLLDRSKMELQSGQLDKASGDAERALRLRLAGKKVEPLGEFYLALGRALLAQGKTDEARVAFRSAAEELQRSLGPDHPDTREAQHLATELIATK